MKPVKAILLSLTIIVLALPVFAWGQSFTWQFGHLTPWGLFPVFGLLAFSIMWLQMAALALGPWLKRYDIPTDDFFAWSGLAFLLFILLHPLVLALAQWQIKAGLPPQSLYAYEPSELQIFITYGLLAWIVFLVTEVALRLKDIPIVQRSLAVLQYINYIAFYLVFWHSLHLGSHVQAGYLHWIWWGYALTHLLFIATYHRRRT